MEQAKRGAERVSGVSNVAFDLAAVFHNQLEAIAALTTYQQDAEAAGDTHAAHLFGRLRDQAQQSVEEIRGVLVVRLQGGDARDRPARARRPNPMTRPAPPLARA